MTDFLPKEVREGLEAARRTDLKRKSRVRVRVGDEVYTVLRIWDDGFALDAETAPNLRGRVDLFSGARHLYQCLVVASAEDRGEMIYEFKRNTAAVDRAPVDFEREDSEPAGLLGFSKS